MMIPISQMIMKTCLQLMKCEPDDEVWIKTYKKDRMIQIIKQTEDYTVIEKGFEHAVYEKVKAEELNRLLRHLKDKEFPKSNQVWIQTKKTR